MRMRAADTVDIDYSWTEDVGWRDDWQESEHPRGQPKNAGQFSKGGGGSKAAEGGGGGAKGLGGGAKGGTESSSGSVSHGIPGLPEGKLSPALRKFAARGDAYEMTAAKGKYGEGRYDVTVTAKPVPGIKTINEGRHTYQYNPKYAHIETLNPEEPIIARDIVVPNEGLRTELDLPRDETKMYRGMSAEEYDNYQKTGEFKSKSDYNFENQQDLTYWSADPGQAESYSSSFAPVQHKPTFEKPAYVVVAHKADPGDIRKVQGTGEDELGVTRAVGKDEVVEVWRGTPVAIAAGDYSVSDRGDGIYEDGSSSPPRADLMWELVQGAGAGAKPPELFKPDETAGLPKTGSQPFTDQKTLYDAARPALDQLKTWLDKGSGVATANGVKLMDKGPGDLTDEEWAKPGAMLFVAGLKGEKRAGEKVASDYGGDWSQLRDVVRCSLAFDTMTDLQTLLDKMKGSGMVLAQQPKDRFRGPTAEGYRDLMMNVTLPNGMIAEVQMHLKAMLVAKNQGHKYYETIRTLAAKPEKEWTPDERTAAQEAQASSQKLYGDAWTQAGGA